MAITPLLRAGFRTESYAQLKIAIEVGCNQAGAYLTQYLFYYIDEANLAAKLLSFERIEKNDVNAPLRRYVSFYPVGQSYFDEKTKTLFIRHLYASAGQCGWEAEYATKNAKIDLIGIKAEWNCQSRTDSDRWKKLNLQNLRKKLGKPINE